MPVEFHRDGPWDLPECWVWARARDFAHVVGGGTPTNASDDSNFDPNGVPWITPADLSGYTATHILRGARSLSPKGVSNSSARQLPKGSLLISSRAPVGYCVVAANDVTTNQGFKSLAFKLPMCAEFFRYYVVYNRKYFVDNASGTTFKELSGQVMSELLFPIAPLNEQRRIVTRIDELFTEIADGEAALARARTDLDTWRRALLKAAVTGELTREWREAFRGNESGAEILSAAAKLKAQFGVRSNRNRLARSDEGELPDLPKIPRGWVWSKLSDFAWASSYGTSTKCSYEASGIAVLRIPNIRSGRIDLADLKRAITALDIGDDDLLDVGDLLIVRTNGSEDLIGRAAMIDEPLSDRFYFASYLIRFRIVSNLLLRQWISIHLESPVTRAWIRKNIATSAGQYNISQTSLMRMPVPVPPESEMRAAIEIFKELELTREHTASDAREADQVVPSVRQSILKAAFEGRLVAQDPRGEPADRLLARTGRAERSTHAIPPHATGPSRYGTRRVDK